VNDVARECINIAAVKRAVAGREDKILDELGIRWRDGRRHIRCPHLSHLDEHPSWRWDAGTRRAFCTCSDKPLSIFDVIMRVEGGDFARAADRAAEIIGRRDLIRGGKKSKRAEYRDDRAERPGLSLAEYATVKALPEDFLRSISSSD
jgi:hypothetical protein